jgi:FkbM family methyltransferase
MNREKLFSFIQYNIEPFFSFALDRFVYTTKSGICKGLRKKGGLGFLPYIYRTSEEQKFLQKLELDGKTIYDVGAYVGDYSLFFSKKVGPTGHVVGFEPNPDLIKVARENAALNHFSNITFLNYALSDCQEIGQLVFDSNYAGAGSLAVMEQERIRKLPKSKTVNVQVDSIDHLISKHHLPSPNLVKIDVQGLEFQVLNGMQQTIKQNSPNLFVEIHAIPYLTWREDNLLKIMKFLERNNYRFIHVESGKAVISEIFMADEHIYAECRQ